MQYPSVELRAGAAAKISQGHPWVFKNGLARGLTVAAGEPVTLVDVAGNPLAVGLADPNSELAVRAFGAPTEIFDAAFFASRLRRAKENRQAWGMPSVTDAWRWVHGENDSLPGFVVDVYGKYAVLKLDGPYERWLEPFVAGLREAMELEGVLHRTPEPKELWGHTPETVVITENEMRMEVNLHAGQKTGLFLDQRDNRRWVRDHAAGRRVLNLFSYTGGFSLAALLGGASHATSVDTARPALETLERSLTLNDLDSGSHQSAAEDVYDFLQNAAKQGRRWDLIILDPPALARGRAGIPQALKAYGRLNEAAMHVLEADGILCTASCTSRITTSEFAETVQMAAARADRRFQIIREAGAGADHPVALHFPEGRYLKFLGMQST